ncbi:MAG: thiamine diphosphokinase [Candidatus Bipolaricaulia bacterium]
MRGVIFANGRYEEPGFYQDQLRSDDFIVGVNGGADFLRQIGVIPQLIVGDLDSIDPETIQSFEAHGVEIARYPTEKDQVDTEIAIEQLLQRNLSEVVLFGAIGDRFDHTLANIDLLKLPLERGLPARIVNLRNEIRLVDRFTRISGEIGDLVSLLPFTDRVVGITLTGFKYPLEESELERGNTLGISNELVRRTATIDVKQGVLLVVRIRGKRSGEEEGLT